MSARRKARKRALDFLYEADIRGATALSLLSERPAEELSQGDYVRELLVGVEEHLSKIDELITTYAQGWDMDRLPAVDRNILRLGIYEILWCKDLDDAIAIDEALNLARELSTDDSAAYIHGVLGRISNIKESLAI